MSIKAQTIQSPIFISVGIFFSANIQAANINGPAIEIIFINGTPASYQSPPSVGG